MAIATATETSFADEVETEPDLEPELELHLLGRSCRCPAANVKASRQRPVNERRLICGACGELVAHARRPASSAR